MNTTNDPELSRLAFEDRLIEFCEDEAVPLLTRVRLLGIAAGRLDSYFMTRVGRLKRLAAEGKGAPKHGGSPPAEELEIVARETQRITQRAYRLLEDQLLPALATHGVHIERWSALSEQDRDSARRICQSELRSLRPTIIGPRQPLPHVRNLRPALIVPVRLPEEATAIVELPANLPRLVRIGSRGGHRFVPLEQLIAANLPSICRGTDGAEAHLFRVTRNGDVDFEATVDLLGSVEQEVVRRPFQEVVRLEVERTMLPEMRALLMRGFQHEVDAPEARLEERDLCHVDGLMDLTALEELADLDLPDLKSAPVTRRTPRIDRQHLESTPPRDQLLQFPFDDYDASISDFLSAAAEHPELLSIKTTVYRTEKDSSVAAALLAARARGADVSAIVEVKASFDERDNIELARTLAAHGVRVMLSPTTLKVHAKIALVTLGAGPTRRQVALIGTGNMNAETARSYIDLWLVTSRPECTSELERVFDVLGGSPKTRDFDCLMVAPFDLRTRFIELIRREAENARAGKPAAIRVMINGLTDPAIIAALLLASQDGVRIDMMVRGVCALTPGVPGISENVRIVSVAGLLLQHARIFHFTNGGDDLYFIGSADWRPRNLDGRVEVVARVPQADHTAMLDRILTETLQSPDGWTLGSDGVYARNAVRRALPGLRVGERTSR
ncbi:MAG TPA: polyphosphate kinase 1 [Gemmatimonadaceae bacterium]